MPGMPGHARKSGKIGAQARMPGKVADDMQDKIIAGPQKLAEEPWFLRLPPEMREAIRSNSQRQPPPGYEQRMQEYFQNTDR